MQPEKLSVRRAEKYLRFAGATCDLHEVRRHRSSKRHAGDIANSAAKRNKADGAAIERRNGQIGDAVAVEIGNRAQSQRARTDGVVRRVARLGNF
jgi:hypothetical protein